MKRLIFILMFVATPLWAVEPHEMLSDPALEARAQVLDEQIRCIRCQSESIASSNAEWAANARVILREEIASGATDQEVLNFFVTRYGERVLMEPNRDGANGLLWWAGPIMLLLGLLVGWGFLRKRSLAKPEKAEELSEAERERLSQIMRD